MPYDRRSGTSPKGLGDLRHPDSDTGERNNRNADRNAERNERRNAVTVLHPQEEERGRGEGGEAPLQKKRGKDENPSGAIAPSGPARPFSPNSSDFPGTISQVAGSLDRGPETVPPAPAAAVPDVQDSSPDQDRDGGEEAAPRVMTSREPKDSRPDTHRDGGEVAAPRVMTTRKKTEIDRALAVIQELWGQPIVHWAKEAKEVKAALASGYQPEQIVACWKAAQESPRWKGRWMPLAYLVEDLGEYLNNGGGPLRKWGQPAKEEVRNANRSALPTAKEWRARRGRW